MDECMQLVGGARIRTWDRRIVNSETGEVTIATSSYPIDFCRQQGRSTPQADLCPITTLADGEYQNVPIPAVTSWSGKNTHPMPTRTED
jgi:hypothetical protein